MIRTGCVLSLAVCCTLAGADNLLAQQAKKAKPMAVSNPAQAGPDFAVQGEYSGAVNTDEGDKKIGVQVIALGEGKFRAVAYLGGLPGDGWEGGERVQTDGQREGDIVKFSSEKGTGIIEEGVLSITKADGQPLAKLKRVERKSETLGAKPPKGAVVLFDGSTPEQFQGGRVTEDRLLMQGITSKQKFQDFTIHMEFRTPYMPAARGQGRGNSGCYLQGRYEVQILDSFGLEGKNNECGGIYEIRDPNVNMCYPPLAWQTYDIDYTAARYDDAGNKTANARMTVRHNGVVVHENVELPRATRASPVKEGPEPGPIYVQDHGNPVRFQNIWVVEK